MRVLIADDDETSRRLLRLALASGGHDVIEASDGQDALEKLECSPADAVISDILMPRMDGYRLCFEARRRPSLRNLPLIIYSSAYSSAQDEAVAVTMGADRFLRKPSPAAAIFRALSEVTSLPRKPSAERAPADELRVLKQYSERLVLKLEERNIELEAAQEKLSAAHGKLERSERRFRELVELAPIGIFQATPDGTFISANTAFARMLGYSSPQELTGLELAHDIDIDPADRLKVLAEINRREDVSTLEVKLKKRDGTLVWVEAEARIVKDPTGAVQRYEVYALDVTERKRTEKETRRSDERYRLLFESNPQPMWVFDEESLAFLAVNEAACRHYGYTGDEFLAMRVSDIGPPEEAPAPVRGLADEPREPSSSSGRRHRRKDGTLIDVEVASHPLFFGGRSAQLVLSTDVTERKRWEEALRDSEERYRLLFEGNPESMWVFDKETLAFLAVNEAACRHYGYTRAEFLAMRISDIHLREDVPALIRELADEPPESQRSSGGRHRLKGGTLIEVEFVSHSLFFGDRPARLVLATDVTERKRAERDTRRSEERFRRLFESNTIGIAVAEIAGSTLEANDVYLDMLGYSREDLRSGMPGWDEITPPEYRALDQAAIEALKRTGIAPPWEKEMLRKDGTRVPVLLGVAMLEESDASCIAYIVDLTASRQLEKQLRQSQKMEAVGQLAGGVAHDFNNLLTTILGYTDLAASRMGRGSAGFDDLEEVRKAGERAAGLTRQLLAFSRLQVLEPRILDLNVIVGNLEKMLRRLIGEDVEVVTTLAPCLGRVRADAGEIEQIIINLAVNARDAMPDGGKITIETSNVVIDAADTQAHVAVRPGRYVLLAVRDTGVGMDAETQSHIFEPFFTTKAKDKGTGLGLSTVYGIVKQSGGNIWVDSEPRRGTTLKIYLPEVEGGAAEDVARLADETPPAGGTETVLLVEDEAPVRALARRILEDLGYTVLESSLGEGGLDIARLHAGPIHLVLTDVVMPEMGGVDLAAGVLLLRPEARVLYMSGYTGDAISRHEVLERGARFLQKPFTPASLGRKVREALS